MGQFFEQIPESLMQWILDQKIFFVSSAPLSGSGHVNVSPKGGQSGQYFGVLDRSTFWYHELTGSGNETASHIYEPGNNRITIMLTAFEGPPRIMRLFGNGRVLENGSRGFDSYVTEHKVQCIPGTRSIILVDIHQVGTSCGFSVPYYDFKDYRPILNDFFKRKAEREAAGHEGDSMPRYWASKNAWSMDGLPGFKHAQQAMRAEGITPLKKMVGPRAPTHFGYSQKKYGEKHLVLVAVVSVLFTLLSLYANMQLGMLSWVFEAKSALANVTETLVRRQEDLERILASSS